MLEHLAGVVGNGHGDLVPITRLARRRSVSVDDEGAVAAVASATILSTAAVFWQ